MTQAMTTKGASRAPARAVSSFPLWCKGSKRMREHQAKASISVQQDQDQQLAILKARPWASPQILSGKGANNWPF